MVPFSEIRIEERTNRFKLADKDSTLIRKGVPSYESNYRRAENEMRTFSIDSKKKNCRGPFLGRNIRTSDKPGTTIRSGEDSRTRTMIYVRKHVRRLPQIRQPSCAVPNDSGTKKRRTLPENEMKRIAKLHDSGAPPRQSCNSKVLLPIRPLRLAAV